MTLTQDRQKQILIASVALLAILIAYRLVTAEKPKTMPLVYERGAVATSRVRPGLLSQAAWADPVNVLLKRREEKFPGTARDIFRMVNPSLPHPVHSAASLPPPPPPPPTPEEIAAQAAQAAAQASRADLSKFRFLGYLAEEGKGTLFLSKDGELFIVKSGDKVLKNYVVKEAGKDYVVLLDTTTRVEARILLSGGEPTFQQSQQAPPQSQPQPVPQPQQQIGPPIQPQPMPQPQQRPPIYRKKPSSG